MVNPRGRRGVIRIWESHTSSTEKKIGKDVMYEDRMHCFHCRRFKTRFEICKNADKELSDIRVIRRHSAEIIIPSRLTNHVMFHHKARWHTQKNVSHTEKRVTQRKSDTQRERHTHTHSAEDQARHHYSIAEEGLGPKRKEGLGPKRKERKEVVRRGVCTRTKGRQIFHLQWRVYNLSRQRCQRSRSNYRPQ